MELNPIEWLAWLHEKVFAGHLVWLLGVLFFSVWAAFAIFIWMKGMEAFEERQPTVSLECKDVYLPVSLQANSTLYSLELSPQNSRNDGLSITQAGLVSSQWPTGVEPAHGSNPYEKAKSAVFGYQCRVMNYSDKPIFSIEMPFIVKFLETKKLPGGGLLGGGAISSSYESIIKIGQLEPKSGEFLFYIYNRSPEFAKVIAPEKAVYQAGIEQKRSDLRLKTIVQDAIGDMTFRPLLP